MVSPHQDPGPIELYDLRSDPRETENLADRYPERVAQLKALGIRELQRRAAARPQFQGGEGSFSPTYLKWRYITRLRALGYLK